MPATRSTQLPSTFHCIGRPRYALQRDATLRPVLIFSLPPHDKDNPFPVPLKRTTDKVKLGYASLFDAGLAENVRRDLITNFSLEEGITKNHPSGYIEVGFWTDVHLAIDNLGELHPVAAYALALEDVKKFFQANRFRCWTNDNYYRKRATSAALAPTTLLLGSSRAPRSSPRLRRLPMGF
ncbi:BQ5605_C007g04437 [Microbotryum silenes-dioicae]|uniref:BQ5605_C007g04437 protein n=1 Tax=Microbotryum silenes-dioicae TaxID=796604 RepID=A0A2X0M6W9_9BASI|nr:BQ5605_C007g04437 [Microbotryum silenes-dioicae]